MKIIALFFVVFSVAVIAASGEMPLTVVNPSVDLTSSSLQRGVQVGKSYYLHNLTFKLASRLLLPEVASNSFHLLWSRVINDKALWSIFLWTISAASGWIQSNVKERQPGWGEKESVSWNRWGGGKKVKLGHDTWGGDNSRNNRGIQTSGKIGWMVQYNLKSNLSNFAFELNDNYLTGTSGTRPPASLCPNGCFGSTLGYMWCPYCKFLLLETRKSCIALITHILQVGSLGCSHGSGLHVRTASKTHVFAFFHDNAGEPTKCLLQCRLHILLKSLIPGCLRKPLYQPPTQHGHRCPGEVHQHRWHWPQIHVLNQ